MIQRSPLHRLAAQASLAAARAGLALGARARRRHQLLRALTRSRRETTIQPA